MKLTTIFFAFLALTFNCPLHAQELLVEGKGGLFRPNDSKFHDIYASGGIYGLEISYQAAECLYFWSSASYLSRSGHLDGILSQLHALPVAVGVKGLFNFDLLDLYVGAGGLGTYLHVHDHSDDFNFKDGKWGFGGIVKAGALVNFWDSFFMDLYADYSFIKVRFHSHKAVLTGHSADLSGWSIGIGLGYRFCLPGCCD